MSDTKSRQFKLPLYHPETSRESGQRKSDQGTEQEGWEAYRRWLKSMNGKQHSRRAPIDHSIYSWKGYQSWADQVRRTWEPEEG